MAVRKIIIVLPLVIASLIIFVYSLIYYVVPVNWQLEVRKNVSANADQLSSDTLKLVQDFTNSGAITEKLLESELPKSFQDLDKNVWGARGEIEVSLNEAEPDIVVLVVRGMGTEYFVIAPILTGESLKQVRLNGVQNVESLDELIKISPHVYRLPRMSGI